MAPTPLTLCLLWSCARAGTRGAGAEVKGCFWHGALMERAALPPVWLPRPPGGRAGPALPHGPGGRWWSGGWWPAGPQCRSPWQGWPRGPPDTCVTARQTDVAAMPTAWPCSRPALAAFGAGRPHCALLARHRLRHCQLHRALQQVMHLCDSWMPGTGTSASLPALRQSEGSSPNPRYPSA